MTDYLHQAFSARWLLASYYQRCELASDRSSATVLILKKYMEVLGYMSVL
jgi:hypothetical protein